MKKRMEKILPAALIGAVGIAVILIGIYYFRFISQRIFEDSTGHLEEIYSQVNRSFGAFIERNWGFLSDCGDYLSLSGETDDEKVREYIQRKQEYWGFTGFYFLSEDGSSMLPDGQETEMALGDSWASLMQDKEMIMAGDTLSSGQEVTAFAVPVPHGEYRGFGYDAIATIYSNADLAASLNVDAFEGQANCFVIHGDGSVLLSTQTGGNIFDNYLTYLKAVSDLSEAELSQIQEDWQDGTSGLLQCRIGEVTHCIAYQPVDYQDYVLLSVVPQSAVSAGFLSVQKKTMHALIVIFLLVGATVIFFFIQRSYKQSQHSRMELQYRDLMFDVLSNSVDDIFLMLGTDDVSGVDFISPNVERLLGIPAEVVREDIRVMKKCTVDESAFIPWDKLQKIPLNGNIVQECEYVHQTTGERRWYRMTAYHIEIQKVTKFIMVLSDRTQERRMNQNLQEALAAARSANEAKSNFLSNMSHDIRTPMNAIVGFSVLLEKDAERPEKVREYTRKITASSHHLLSLINDVLDMSKIESGKTSLNVDRFSLPEIMEEMNIILMPQAKAKNQDFRVHVQGAPPEQLIGDRLRLNQILINLLSNAIKYTPVGGSIEFQVSGLPQAQPQYAKLRFVVKDNGIGMSREFQKQIFNPFSRENDSMTSKIQGTGLGMAITKNLVDLMGGIIQLESEPGKGSTFTVELSFQLPEQDESEFWASHKITRMLVVDDEEEVCEDIRELMEEKGVNVTCVTEGQAAVTAAADAHQRGEDFQVILLDWKMPEMDGVKTARGIRAQVGDGVPILALTSCDWSDIEEEARRAGIDAFMPKPFFVSTFCQTISPLFAEDRKTETSAIDTAEHAKTSPMAGRMFLVAEDNELNAEILAAMLEMEGARYEIAVNGLQAVEMFAKSAPGDYDMILMDVQMPVMNGYEATRQIRACGHPQARTIPIAAMTANTFAEDVSAAMNAGMNGHLGKPIDMDAVRKLTAKLLGGSADTSDSAAPK